MLKILHVIPSVSRSEGGPSYAVFAFAQSAKTAGFEATIVTTGDIEPDQDGTECLRFRRQLEPYKISFPLRRWLDRHVRDFDLVHIHALFSFSSWAAAKAARQQGVPYVIRPLGVLNRWGLANRRPFLKRFWLRFIETPILKNAAAIHYTTQAECDEAALLGQEIGRLPSFIVPIPVSGSQGAGFTAGGRELFASRAREAGDSVSVETEFQRTEDRGQKSEEFWQSCPQARGKKIVLFLGRLDQKKGLDILLQAFADVKSKQRDVILVIAGTGERNFVDGLHQQAKGLGIDDDVAWTGFLSGSQKMAALSAADLFVLPSYSENFGIAAAEALAAGVPTILSDQVAIATDAATSKAAAVVRPTTADLASAIAQLLSDRSKREELGQNGKAFAQRFFSSEQVSGQLAAEYRKIVSRIES